METAQSNGHRHSEWHGPQALAAALGLAAPLAAGIALGRPNIATAAAFGALAMSGTGEGSSPRRRIADLGRSLAAGCLAMLAGTAAGGGGPVTSLLVPLIAAAAGLVGGVSRSLARVAGRFVLYFIIAAHLDLGGSRPAVAILLFILGGLWTGALSLGARALFRLILPKQEGRGAPEESETASHPVRFLLRRWKKTLGSLAAWHYVIRLGLSLAAAEACVLAFPGRHGQWAVLTAGILVERDLQGPLGKTMRRAAGTSLGVLAAGLLLLGAPPAWAAVSAIAALAAARVVLRDSNYAAYSAVMTLLVLLLLDVGGTPSWILLADRLVATLVGCVIALTLGNPAPYRRFLA